MHIITREQRFHKNDIFSESNAKHNDNILFHEGGTIIMIKMYICEGVPINHEEK
jgi:hypothetical protein